MVAEVWGRQGMDRKDAEESDRVGDSRDRELPPVGTVPGSKIANPPEGG